MYDVVSVATSPNMKRGVKTTQRWCEGQKNQNKKKFRIKKLLSKIVTCY